MVEQKKYLTTSHFSLIVVFKVCYPLLTFTLSVTSITLLKPKQRPSVLT